MPAPALLRSLRLEILPILAGLALVAGCTGDTSLTGPPVDNGSTGGGSDDGTGGGTGGGTGNPTEPTHYEVSVKMSSIAALENCENDPGNPGEFRYTLLVRKTDELGNNAVVGSYTGEMSIDDGSTIGSTMEPIRFVMRREPGATFQVEYWVGEYDGANTDFEKHGWMNHVWDRNETEAWAAGIGYDSYHDGRNPGGVEGESYGILKFAVWNTRAECKGYARYIVRWTPVTPTA
jgi:hypothetical protein